MDPDLPAVGDAISNTELARRFACSNTGGMRRSHKTNTLVLVSDPHKGFYSDTWHSNILHYTGMGKTGDQRLDFGQNRTLANLSSSGVAAYLFEVFEPGSYTFIGRVQLDAEPYQAEQADSDGNLRRVWIFPLRLADGQVPFRPADHQLTGIQAAQQHQARKLSNQALARLAQRPNRPAGPREATTTVRQRDPYVAEYAKRRANGHCQLCGEPAPFKVKGEPYLECHHVHWLSRGGPDTITNTVALCPNCHRRMHALDHDGDSGHLARLAEQPLPGEH